MFYCMFYFTCDRSLMSVDGRLTVTSAFLVFEASIVVVAVDVAFEAFLPELLEPRIATVVVRTQPEVVFVEVADFRWIELHRHTAGDVVLDALDNIRSYRPAVTVTASQVPWVVPPENCDIANFRVFAQLSQISGCFGANNLPFWGNLGANWMSTHNLSFPKFVAVCPKIATSCLHTYFNFYSRCHWARLMTLRRIVYSIVVVNKDFVSRDI